MTNLELLRSTLAYIAEHDWVAVDDELPDNDVVVETISPGGMESKLKRVGKLWFFPDDSMYVYYTPMYWRKIND